MGQLDLVSITIIIIIIHSFNRRTQTAAALYLRAPSMYREVIKLPVHPADCK